jgi:hypothetical protein
MMANDVERAFQIASVAIQPHMDALVKACNEMAELVGVTAQEAVLAIQRALSPAPPIRFYEEEDMDDSGRIQAWPEAAEKQTALEAAGYKQVSGRQVLRSVYGQPDPQQVKVIDRSLQEAHSKTSTPATRAKRKQQRQNRKAGRRARR